MVEKLLVLNPLLDIIILDNGSTYPPLLEWYKTIHCQKYFLENQGHLALWSIGLDKKLGDYFVYTDSDIILNDNFPKNWMFKMYQVLQKYKCNKVSLALEINDLPEHYRYINQVIRNEGRWWLEEVEDGIFKADTDTTFSLYKNIHDNTYPSLRIAKDNMICKT
jgi:glycosyltransferase involved in cell wall biosynthesis